MLMTTSFLIRRTFRPYFSRSLFTTTDSMATQAESIIKDHYTAGSTFPPLKPGVLRIYGMRYCPFVQRVLLVLEAKKVPYETINCNLQSKPEWLFEKNPRGLVPVLEQDDKLLTESLIISDYLDEAYTESKLHPSDPYKKAVDRMMVENNLGKLFGIFKYARQGEEAQDGLKAFHEGANIWEEELKKRGTPFFGGEKPLMIDYMMWPFFERADAVQSVLPECFPPAKFPLLTDWVTRMKEDPAGKAAFQPAENHIAYFKEVLPLKYK